MSKDILSSYRKRLRRRNLMHKIYALIFFFAFTLTLLVVFFYIPYFQIRTVSLSGVETADEKELRKHIDDYFSKYELLVFPRVNIFVASRKKITGLIKDASPRIGAVSISKNLPADIFITVSERKTWATICKNKECFYAARDGVLFEYAPRVSGSIFLAIQDRRKIKYNLGESFLPADELQIIQLIIDTIEDETGIKFATLEISSDQVINHYKLTTDEKWKIIFDSLTDPYKAVENFNLAYYDFLKEDLNDIDYFDLRLENKLFYKKK